VLPKGTDAVWKAVAAVPLLIVPPQGNVHAPLFVVAVQFALKVPSDTETPCAVLKLLDVVIRARSV
jgi:hypothetical protein